MSGPVLVAVAHGSRTAAAQRTVEALLDGVRASLPETTVRPAFVEHAEPALADVLAHTGRGTVVVPLLLSRGFHVGEDVERVARRVGVATARPLGPDPLLCDALLNRLAESGAPGGTPVVLAAAGSRDPRAAVDVEQQAAALRERTAAPVVAAYAAAARPTLNDATAAVLRRTGRPAVVLPYLLGPGYFLERMQDSAATWVAPPLGAHPAVVSLVVHRYHEACRPAVHT